MVSVSTSPLLVGSTCRWRTVVTWCEGCAPAALSVAGSGAPGRGQSTQAAMLLRRIFFLLRPGLTQAAASKKKGQGLFWVEEITRAMSIR